MRQVHSRRSALILSITLLLSGCTSMLVRDDVKRTAGLDGHCAGSEWVDDSFDMRREGMHPILRLLPPRGIGASCSSEFSWTGRTVPTRMNFMSSMRLAVPDGFMYLLLMGLRSQAASGMVCFTRAMKSFHD